MHNVVSHTYAPAPFLVLNLTFGLSDDYIIQATNNVDWGISFGHFDKMIRDEGGWYP